MLNLKAVIRCVYEYKDHLENIRLSYTDTKYNGKEFIEMHGYDTYDYGARGYYPAIMRFTTVDPLAEEFNPCKRTNLKATCSG